MIRLLYDAAHTPVSPLAIGWAVVIGILLLLLAGFLNWLKGGK